MHQALYRKWRPQTFDQVCGQEHITSVLSYAVSHQRVSHAYLFCGSRGTGKTSCAKILAKAVNCESPVNGSPCCHCDACLSIEAGTATDVLEMDAASNNGVDNVRDIRDEVLYAPSTLRNRVYIIDEVHMLSSSAFNALLKTLEEPPSNVVFILATTELQKLPATIISRCQRFDFHRISLSVLRDRLLYIANEEGIDLEEDAAITLARLARGGMRDAISLLELNMRPDGHITRQSIAETTGIVGRERLAALIAHICAGNTAAIFETIANLFDSSKDIAVFWQDLLSYYRDILVFRASPNAEKILDLTGSEMEELKQISASMKYEIILYHISLLEKAYQEMQRAETSRRLIAEMTLLRMTNPSLDTSLEALLARISALEDRLSMGIPTLTEANASEKTAASPSAPSDSIPASAPTENLSHMRPLGCWVEVVHKFESYDRVKAAFLRDTHAFYDAKEQKVLVSLSNKLAFTMLDSPAVCNSLIRILSAFQPVQSLAFTLQTLSETDGYQEIDEIAREIKL